MKKLVFMFLSCSVMIFINGCAERTKISSEWGILEFLISDENINKQSEVDYCYARNDNDSAQCDKILDTWRESCARGEEKYCIAIFKIHSEWYPASNSKIDKSLTLLKTKL